MEITARKVTYHDFVSLLQLNKQHHGLNCPWNCAGSAIKAFVDYAIACLLNTSAKITALANATTGK